MGYGGDTGDRVDGDGAGCDGGRLDRREESGE